MFDCLFLSIETNNENEMATNRSRVPYILQTKRYFNFFKWFIYSYHILSLER